MSPRRRRPPVNRRFKIDLLLKPADLDAYRSFLSVTATTVETAHAWLKERGYLAISRSAVARHKRLYLEQEATHAAHLRSARAYARVAGSPHAPDLLGGALLFAEHQVFEKVWDYKDETCYRAECGEWIAPAELCEMLDLLSAMIRTREQFETFKQAAKQGAEAQRAATPQSPAVPDAADVPQWERLAREVRRLLGHPLPEDGGAAKG